MDTARLNGLIRSFNIYWSRKGFREGRMCLEPGRDAITDSLIRYPDNPGKYHISVGNNAVRKFLKNRINQRMCEAYPDTLKAPEEHWIHQWLREVEPLYPLGTAWIRGLLTGPPVARQFRGGTPINDQISWAWIMYRKLSQTAWPDR